ncbi:HAD-IA family hydrolase [Gymnodinialimonas sp. 2305UL16-5]|uniref:HAD-IA family hydrolase n=1 Tax=Gymnodinialimonas mytili TaxID=3126503 RepID=UPI00309A00B2
MTLRLVIFDVDGTLVDSIAFVERVMADAHHACGLPLPAPGAVRALVGVSLPGLLAQLHPGLSDTDLNRLQRSYMDLYAAASSEASVDVSAPLFPGTRDMLEDLARHDDLLLAIATGKSRRGLTRLLAQHEMDGHFVSTQVADDHPSKPHPSMALTALVEAGVAAEDAILVGDTTFDMDMARAAGVFGVGVGWGNHAADHVAPSADHMIDDWHGLRELVGTRWGMA